ncbi:MAG: PEP-CTERM sorting domain-containing protein [Opitutaceae bacterium]|nr:PEP-CTERM sorting domain-containing protein [Opitutaceae bacterium]
MAWSPCHYPAWIGSTGICLIRFITGLTLAGMLQTPAIAQVNFVWNGGDLVGGVITPSALPANTVLAGNTLTLATSADHDLQGLVLTNQGTITWNSGYIRGGAGSSILNAVGGTFNDANFSGYTVHNPGWGGSFIFTNDGDYVRNTTNTTFFDIPFNNNGTVDLQQGDIQFRAGGALASGGSITAASGTNVYFTSGYTIANGTSLGGAGTFRLTAGTMTASGTINVGNFIQTGGAFVGTTTLGGAYSWNGGNWNTANVTVASTTGVLTLANNADHDFNGGTIVNQGTVNWQSGYIRGGSGATFTNAAGATFNDLNASSYTVHNPGWGGSFVFTNDGTYVRNAGGTTHFDVAFNNNGTVDLQQGDIQFRAGGTLTASGQISAASGTNVYFTNGYNVSNGSSLTGAGTYRLTGGTLNLSGQVNVGTFRQTGGSLAGTGTLNGLFLWDGGNWNGSSITVAASTGILTLANNADHDFNGGTIVNQGTVNWQSGYIRGGSGATFTNAAGATFNDYNVSGFTVHNPGWGGSFVFTNDGTYVRNSTNTTYFDIPFNNNGTVDLQQGDIQFRAGGTLTASGQISAASGTNVYFTNGYNVSNGSSLTGAGTYRLTGGTLNLSGQVNVGTFRQTGGSLAGTGTLNGLFLWDGGNWNGSSITVAASTGILTLANNTEHDLNGGTIVNQGTVNWQSGYIRGGSGATFTNAAGATFNDYNVSGFTMHNPGWGGSFVFTNDGAYVRNSTNTTYFDIPFNNNGSVSLLQGDIQYRAGGSITASGTIAAAAGTHVYFTNGYNVSNSSSLTGPGTYHLTGGTLNLAGQVNVGTFQQTGGTLAGTGTLNGAFLWNGGNWNGASITVAPGTGALTLGNGADHDFNGGTIVNQGTVSWLNGHIRSGSGGSFTNAAGATFHDLNASGYSVLNPGWGGSVVFTNDGTYIRDAGSTTYFNVPFVNGGTLSLRQGELRLTTSNTFQPSGTLAFTLAGPTAGADFGTLNVTNTLLFDGLLQVTFADGYEASVTAVDTFTLANAGALSGSFLNVADGGTLLTSDGLGQFTVNYGTGSAFAANSLVLSNFTPVPEPSTFVLLALGAAAVLLYHRRR